MTTFLKNGSPAIRVISDNLFTIFYFVFSAILHLNIGKHLRSFGVIKNENVSKTQSGFSFLAPPLTTLWFQCTLFTMLPLGCEENTDIDLDTSGKDWYVQIPGEYQHPIAGPTQEAMVKVEPVWPSRSSILIHQVCRTGAGGIPRGGQAAGARRQAVDQ